MGGVIGILYAARNTEPARRALSVLKNRRFLHDYRRAQSDKVDGTMWVPATDNSPEIDFRFLDGKLSIRGQMSPGSGRLRALLETAAESLNHFLRHYHGPLEFVFELDGVPSFLLPDIRELVRLLAVAECPSVVVRWKYDGSSEFMRQEAGSFKEVFEAERRKNTYIFTCIPI